MGSYRMRFHRVQGIPWNICLRKIQNFDVFSKKWPYGVKNEFFEEIFSDLKRAKKKSHKHV